MCHFSTLHQEMLKHKTGRGRRDTSHLESVMNVWVVQCQPETLREPKKGTRMFRPPWKLTVGPENHWRELANQSPTKWKDVSFTKKVVLSDSLIIRIDTGKTDHAGRNCEQPKPSQSFTISLWTAWERDRQRLNQWQGQLSMGEETERDLPALKLAVWKESLLSFARTIPWLHSIGRNKLFICTDLWIKNLTTSLLQHFKILLPAFTNKLDLLLGQSCFGSCR